ncbi:MAG: penicillin-binding transpeptidase domain-containing protein [Bryobacteraceae bacterium]
MSLSPTGRAAALLEEVLSLLSSRTFTARTAFFLTILTLGDPSLILASRKPKRVRLKPAAILRFKSNPKPKPQKAPTRGPWRVPTYADSTEGDRLEGEDLVVRRAAVDALNGMNGTVVVADPHSGRILSIVNQKLAFKDGYQPCSTVKVPVALAALSETIVERTTPIRLYGKTTMTLTEALAKSNNQYFAGLGQKLGFDRVSYYAHLFGLGEKAGFNIEQERAGILPPSTPRNGIGMMTSFGDGIALTPLELTALIGAVANGGTLYYLQYPESSGESITPRVKRQLDIEMLIPEIRPGMAGAVEYGTARRIGFDPDEPIFGKTGTCTDSRTPTHLGWFGSFIERGNEKLVVTVLLTGAKGVSGPAAAGVAGNVYKNLDAASYFQQLHTTVPVAKTDHFGFENPAVRISPQSLR